MTPMNCTRVLQAVVAHSPDASLHQIRRAHPALRAMSMDQLALRLSRLLEAAEDLRAK